MICSCFGNLIFRTHLFSILQISMAKAVNFLLLDGTINGPKIAQIGNWIGRATYSPMEKAAETLSRDEFDGPGVYILKGSPESSAYNEKVYIGESGELRPRLKSHLSKLSRRPFDSFVAVTSKDRTLNKATIKYLEHKLIEDAHQNKTSEVYNKINPKLPSISEADEYSMRSFLGEMKIILPLLGFEFMTPSVITPQPKVEIKDLYKLHDKVLKAFMYVEEGKFIVTKGSQMRSTESKSLGKGWAKLRAKIIREGIAIHSGNYYEFTQDVSFNSTSAASSVMLGRQSPGPRVWIHTQNGKTYGQLLELQSQNL